MTLTVAALIAVLAVLVFTGRGAMHRTRYLLTVTPSAPAVSAGHSVRCTVEVSAMDDFSGRVDLSVTALPAGIAATLAAPSVNVSSAHRTADVELTLRAGANAAAGPVEVMIVGASGRLTETATITLTAAAAATP